MNKSILKITLLNELTFEFLHKKYNLEDYLTNQLLNLLEVLIINYGEHVTTERLINILWGDSDNPKSSLKFHVYKLRKSLSEIPEIGSFNFIKTTKGGYEFNPDIECIIDTSVIQNNYTYIQGDKSLDEQTIQYAQAIEETYKGPLRYNNAYFWFIQLGEFYHDIYTITIQKMSEYYLSNNMNSLLKSISLKAAGIDPTIESTHIYYIQALINLNEYTQAFDYYQKSTKMLIDEYAISLSDRMLELYDNLINGFEDKQNIEAITHYFKKNDYDEGAFYCERTIFDYIYNMYLRGSTRTNCKYYLFIFEVVPTTNIEKQIIKTKTIIQESLRSGDVFTRISKYQFLALLPCENDEIGHLIAQRVTHNIRKKTSPENTKVFYFIDKVIDGEKRRD
ncbi:MAG: winged helix-turn-helix domain-containing protein [Coprobacillus sp.]